MKGWSAEIIASCHGEATIFEVTDRSIQSLGPDVTGYGGKFEARKCYSVIQAACLCILKVCKTDVMCISENMLRNKIAAGYCR